MRRSRQSSVSRFIREVRVIGTRDTHYAVGMVGGGWSQIGNGRSEEDAPGVASQVRAQALRRDH